MRMARSMSRSTKSGRAGRPPTEPTRQTPGLVTHSEDGAPRQGLTATFWFGSGHAQERSSATVRFSGRRIGVSGRRGRGDDFVKEETVGGIVPDGGALSITTRILDINPGAWTVTAELLTGHPRSNAGDTRRPQRAVLTRGRALDQAVWSWR